ncbi:MAG: dTDP-4-dehydrorhamnose reductase [Gemmatimonadaceae bacterium]
MSARVLLLGASGQVGRELRARLPRSAELTAPSRAELPLEHVESLRTMVRATRPALVLNAAAYTAVDRAESEPRPCRAINAVAPMVLAEECARIGAALVHYSTNFVFDGSQPIPWREDDPTRPLNVYGTTKLEGERGITRALERQLILRTALVFSREGESFVQRIRRLARERDDVSVVTDQFGTPTSAAFLAESTIRAIEPLLAGGSVPWGTYHLTAAGQISIYDYAVRVLALDPNRAEHRCTQLRPITSAELHAPARRPLNGVLDCGRFSATFGIALPPWEEELERELSAR